MTYCNSEKISLSEASRLLGCSERHCRRLCETGKLPGAVKEGSTWLIPRSADSRLHRIYTPDQLSEMARLDQVPVSKRKKALEKAGLVFDAEKFAANAIREGRGRVDAIETFAASRGVSVRVVYKWIKQYRQFGVEGLIDSRGGKYIEQKFSPEAFELFKQYFLDLRRPSVKQCYDIINFVNQRESRGWVIPSLRRVQQIVQKEIPEPVKVLHREGRAAYDAKCAPYLIIDPDSAAPGEIWVGDHHQFNLWVRSGDSWVRPWITAWLDWRSRYIVGFCISESPNQTTILKAFRDAAKQHGLPSRVHIDNGRDYDSELFTGATKKKRKALKKGYIDEPTVKGVYANLSVDVTFAIPYHPQSKRIERFFDTADMKFSKTFPSYCGKDSARKPEMLNNLLKDENFIRSTSTLQEFSQKFSVWLSAYGKTCHTGSGMNGRSPQAVFAGRERKRVCLDESLDLLCRNWCYDLKITKNGLRVKGLPYGFANYELHQRHGQFVHVSYDSSDMSAVLVYDKNFKLICRAEHSRLVGYRGGKISEAALRQATREKARIARIDKAHRKRSKRIFCDLTDLAIEAQQALEEKSEIEENARTVPVRTVFDMQHEEHSDLEKASARPEKKKKLTFDHNSLKPEQVKRKLTFNLEDESDYRRAVGCEAEEFIFDHRSLDEPDEELPKLGLKL